MRNLTDRAVGRLLRLSAPNTGYSVRRVAVPMRDGATLQADHYTPTGEPSGTLLVRTPYGRRFPTSLMFARLYAARGYHVILQSVRGTFGSGGTFEPMVNEVADGADTVAWLRRQPWFTGSFATIGVSYLGLTQWALLIDPPPELAAAVITVGLHDFSAAVWESGSFALQGFLGWCDLTAHQEDGGQIRAGIRQLRTWPKVTAAADGLPLGATGRALLGSGAPWYESWLEHPDLNDPFWEPYRFDDALERVRVPVLLLGGWQDLFLEQTLTQYRRLRGRGVDVALTIGPWTHTEMLTKGLGTVTRESLNWLDTHLSGSARTPRTSAVRIFVTGQGWRDMAAWPPTTTRHTMYLQPDGGLAEAAPAASTTPATFCYDPNDPTPTVGGPLLAPNGGYRNDTRLARRPDVVSFTGDALTEDLQVFGNPVVELDHSADNPHVDLFARISQVDSRGRSHNVTESYRRLTGQSGPVRIELDAIAHRFAAGSRIRVLIAGGNHPRYARNLGTAAPPAYGVALRPATHTVRFGSSRLVLPLGGPNPDHQAAPPGV
jgi:putative CocE/NonD family hydrolase